MTGRIKQKHLEILLSKLESNPNPKLKLETYALDSKSAAHLLFIAGFLFDDIINKRVVDLGCGNGILAIGAALLNAQNTVGVDIDTDSIKVAKQNAMKMGVKINYVCSEIEAIQGSFDTTLMNPPFGSWCRGADVKFLHRASKISSIVYSLHKRNPSNRRFLTRKITCFGGKVDKIFELEIKIDHTFDFHKKKMYPVSVDLYRICLN